MDVLDRIRQIADTVKKWPAEKLAMTKEHLMQGSEELRSRITDIPCPVCGDPLLEPWPDGGYPNWECFACMLEVPAVARITGERLLTAYRDPAQRTTLKWLFPDIRFEAEE